MISVWHLPVVAPLVRENAGDMIRLGVRGEYAFEGPLTLGGWTPPDASGIFAIMYREAGRTERFAVIYVGETESFAGAGFPFKHPEAPCWIERVESRWKLSVAYLTVPGGTPSIRRAIVKGLIYVYDPVCNEVQALNEGPPPA
jgi:hypothetical protein